MRIAHNNFVASGAAEILIVYQKEPHPGQMAFENIAQPETFEERCSLAQKMKDEYELPMTVLVDTMEDHSRALFSDLPSPAFVIDKDGIVRHKFPWAEGEQIEAAIGVVTGTTPVSYQEVQNGPASEANDQSGADEHDGEAENGGQNQESPDDESHDLDDESLDRDKDDDDEGMGVLWIAIFLPLGVALMTALRATRIKKK